MNDEKILVFKDDVLWISKEIDEGLNRLDKLLQTLSNAEFSFNLKKYLFLKVPWEYCFSWEDYQIKKIYKP